MPTGGRLRPLTAAHPHPPPPTDAPVWDISYKWRHSAWPSCVNVLTEHHALRSVHIVARVRASSFA